MDIVEKLRAGHQYSGIVDPLDKEAANEIERLRAMLDKIAEHPDVSELIRQYAAGRLFSPGTGDWRLETHGQTST